MKRKIFSMLLVWLALCAFMPMVSNAENDTAIEMAVAEISKEETDTEYIFTVEATNTYENCQVYAALYDAEGRLITFNRVPLESTSNTEISLDKSIYNAEAKVFIWSEDMEAIIEPEEFTLTPQPTSTPIQNPSSNVTWSFNATTETLTISGEGEMKDYNSSSLPFGDSSIKSVIIENGVTSIGDYAFSSCSDLTSITIPESVTDIGDSAFNGCSSLKEIYYDDTFSDFAKICVDSYNTCLTKAKLTCSDITTEKWGKCGDTVAYYLDVATGTLTVSGIGDMEDYDSSSSPFDDSNIKALIIENGVTGIGKYAFSKCEGITSIKIGNSVKSIADSAFGYCGELDGVYITDLVAYLNISGPSPMRYSGKLYLNNEIVSGDIILPNTATSICKYAFSHCEGITSVVIPDSISSIGDHAFSGCGGLKSVTIPNSVNSIGENAFRYCISLTNVTIPNSVENIGEYAFYGCNSLTSVTIGNGVTSIGDYTFEKCSNLNNVYITDFATYLNMNGSSPMRYARKLYLDNEIVAGDMIIPDTATNICKYAFYNCYGMTSITIPNSVTSIGNHAFDGCSSLTTLDYNAPKVLSNINGLKNLTLVILGDNVTSIDADAFKGFDKLERIVIPSSVTKIENGTFSDCSALTTVDYRGSEAEWDEIYIGEDNDYLKNADITFNFIEEVSA